MAFHIYIGSYTNEIYTLAFDPDTLSLTLVSTLTVGFHPSWLTPHPKDPSIVFAGLEQTDGKIVAVKFDDEGHGTLLGSVSSGGGGPCSLVETDSELLVGNVRLSQGIPIQSLDLRIPVRDGHVCRHPFVTRSALFERIRTCLVVVFWNGAQQGTPGVIASPPGHHPS